MSYYFILYKTKASEGKDVHLHGYQAFSYNTNHCGNQASSYSKNHQWKDCLFRESLDMYVPNM